MNLPALAPPFIHATYKRRRQTWYTVKDGNWSDPSVWASNGVRGRNYPTFSNLNNIAGLANRHEILFNNASTLPPIPSMHENADDVVVMHNIVYDQNINSHLCIHNLTVTDGGSFTWENFGPTKTLHILGNINASNLFLLFSSATPSVMLVYGDNNYIGNFTCASQMAFGYAGINKDQKVLPLNYGQLYVLNGGTKYLPDNLSVAGALYCGLHTAYTRQNFYSLTTVEIGSGDLTVGGMLTFSQTLLKKTTPGNITIGGGLNGNNTIGGGSGIDFSGNPNVEIKGGSSTSNAVTTWNSGTGTWKFSTANQSIQLVNRIFDFNGPVLIDNITLTTVAHQRSPLAGISINNSLNGTTSTSKIVNNDSLIINTATPIMTTGQTDFTSGNNLIALQYAGDLLLQQTAYWTLYVSGHGSKTAIGDTTLSGKLMVRNVIGNATIQPKLDMGPYNLAVNGLTDGENTIGDHTLTKGYLVKQQPGNILFAASVVFGNGYSLPLDLTGNPTVEFRNGVRMVTPSGGLTTGNPMFVFTTNNQTWSYGGAPFDLDTDILISGAIKVTSALVGTTAAVTLLRPINGNNALSEFDSRCPINYQASQAPMLTGILSCNNAANTFKYNRTGDQDVKGGTYRTLEFGGSGVKKLLGDVVVNTSAGGAWSITGTATIDYNGFTITTI